MPVDDRLGAGPEVGVVREQAKQQEIVDAQHFATARIPRTLRAVFVNTLRL